MLSDQLLSGQLKKLKDGRAADKEEFEKLEAEEKEKLKAGLTYWQASNNIIVVTKRTKQEDYVSLTLKYCPWC